MRKFLPPETKLSITGLPTWTTSDEIGVVLAAVDFWIPQCYGASIPVNANKRVPISSPSSVEHTIAAVRRLGKPFYAGLAAYSYAIVYDTNGNLVELRGDIDPAEAARNDQLELVETQNFGVGEKAAELRYVYRAKGDLVIDGLIMRPGETLVFDLPSAASLQASARAVRENAGDLLLGICIFRLPTGDDGATLGPDEIAAALNDRSTDVITKITLSPDTGNKLTLSAENRGTANTRLAEDAFTIDVRVPMGSIGGASAVAGFTSYETLCSRGGAETPRPCSDRRADVIRLRARSWRPGTTASVTFVVRNSLPATLPAAIQTRVDDGRIVTRNDRDQKHRRMKMISENGIVRRTASAAAKYLRKNVVRNVIVLLAGTVTALACGWSLFTDHSVRFNSFRNGRGFYRLPPLPILYDPKTGKDMTVREVENETTTAKCWPTTTDSNRPIRPLRIRRIFGGRSKRRSIAEDLVKAGNLTRRYLDLTALPTLDDEADRQGSQKFRV